MIMLVVTHLPIVALEIHDLDGVHVTREDGADVSRVLLLLLLLLLLLVVVVGVEDVVAKLVVVQALGTVDAPARAMRRGRRRKKRGGSCLWTGFAVSDAV
jgi:ABC-type iron transport system FetAB permease component